MARVTKSEQKTVSAKAVKKQITAEERFNMIEKEAYYIAEKDGFRGDTTSYWVAAEKAVLKKHPVA
jgi:hypothetical protein